MAVADLPRQSVTEKASANERRRAKRVLGKLTEAYPDAHCALNHNSAFELLIATILSAQCTDERVNMVTPNLFQQYPTPKAMAQAPIPSLEELVRTTGFFRNKAKNIKAASLTIVDEFGGEVPDSMDELLTLPGVARKTANVVLGNAFGINHGMVVDTHIGRLSHRLGFTEHHPKDAVRIERDIMAKFPQDSWTHLAHLLISHGRAVCQARKPRCSGCLLKRGCPRQSVTQSD